VRRLHRFPYYPHQIIAQGVEVRLVPELGGEGFEGLCRIVRKVGEKVEDELGDD